MKNCLDEGTIHGYLDGELSPALMKDAATHIAACDACAAAAREADMELSMFAAAFADDASIPVPTARLREGIDARIAGLRTAASPYAATLNETKQPLRQRLAALLSSFTLTPARTTAFASLLVLVIVGLVVAPVLRERTSDTGTTPELAAVRENTPTHARATDTPTGANVETGTLPATGETTNTTTNTTKAHDKDSAKGNASEASPSRNGGGARVMSASLKTARGNRQPARATTAPNAGERTNGAGEKPTPERELALPGEENYLIAIASLNSIIEAGGDAAVRPALRADMERNVADLDQAISASRRRALRNPQDKDASDFLFAAYQSKVELLRTVADQSQMAMLGR